MTPPRPRSLATRARTASLAALAMSLAPLAAQSACELQQPAGTTVLVPSDGWTQLHLPFGFAFPFAGATYSDFYISDHGLVSLTNGGIPAQPPGNSQVWSPGASNLPGFGADVVCAYWMDTTNGATGNAGVFVDNSSGTHCTVTWVDNRPYPATVSYHHSFQVTFYPTGQIDVVLDARCRNRISGYGESVAVIGVYRDGSVIPVSADLSNASTTNGPTLFEEFDNPSTLAGEPDPDFDLGAARIRFVPGGAGGWSTTISRCAATLSYGAGCSGLTLTSSSAPVIGASWELHLSGVTAPAGTPCLLSFGAATTPSPIGALLPTLFGPTCSGHVDLSLGLYDVGPATAGALNVSIPIAPNPALQGMLVAVQGVALDGTPAGLFAASNGEIGALGI